jgi:DNA-binding IscR family transcriptional regulator
LRIAVYTARAFAAAAPAPTAEELSSKLAAPIRIVRGVLEELEAADILAPRGGTKDGEAFQLAQPAARIRVADVLRAVHGGREPASGDEVAPVVEGLLAKLDSAALSGGAGRSLEDLLGELQDGAADADFRLGSADVASLDPSGTAG